MTVAESATGVNALPQQKVHIIGIGDDGSAGLTSTARQLIDNADRVFGSSTILGRVSGGRQREPVSGDLAQLVQLIEAHPDDRLVILATGDPLFYGVARFLCDQLGKERFEVVPHVSSMQLAFARVKESWDEAYLSNLATTDLNVVCEKCRTAEKVGLFTTEDHSPAAVAQSLLDRGIDYFSVYVCENLGSPDERVTQCNLDEVSRQKYSPLNVMILVRRPDVPDRPTEIAGQQLFGNPDEAFLQSKPKRGLITGAEVRVIALAELGLQPQSTVWDVGAGSGAVAIEAAQVAHAGRVYAIEMDVEDYQLVAENAQRFGVTNLIPVLGAAPDAWSDLPDADAIFIGGTGRAVSEICRLAVQRLRPRGNLVANITSINHVAATHEVLRTAGLHPLVRMISVSLSTEQMENIRFEAFNPTFLVTAKREA